MANLNYEIRRYQSNDHPQVVALNRSALNAAGAFDHAKPDADTDLDNIEGVYLHGRGEFLIAEADGPSGPAEGERAIVGMGALRPTAEGPAEIKRMRVATAYQQCGVATALLEQLEQVARRIGYTDLVLDAGTELHGAQRFYESQGFVKTGRGSLHGVACVFYRKPFR